MSIESLVDIVREGAVFYPQGQLVVPAAKCSVSANKSEEGDEDYIGIVTYNLSRSVVGWFRSKRQTTVTFMLSHATYGPHVRVGFGDKVDNGELDKIVELIAWESRRRLQLFPLVFDDIARNEEVNRYYISLITKLHQVNV